MGLFVHPDKNSWNWEFLLQLGVLRGILFWH